MNDSGVAICYLIFFMQKKRTPVPVDVRLANRASSFACTVDTMDGIVVPVMVY